MFDMLSFKSSGIEALLPRYAKQSCARLREGNRLA